MQEKKATTTMTFFYFSGSILVSYIMHDNIHRLKHFLFLKFHIQYSFVSLARDYKRFQLPFKDNRFNNIPKMYCLIILYILPK